MEKMMKVSGILLCMVVLICSAFTVAEATTVNFEIGGDNSIVNASGALTIDYTIDHSLSGVSFTLSEGDSETFNYAEIFEITVNDNSYDTFDITAYLDFVFPDVGVVGNEGVVSVIMSGQSNCNGNCNGDGDYGMSDGCGMSDDCGSTDTFNIVFDLATVYFGSGDTGEFTVKISDLYNMSWAGGSCCSSTSAGGALEATVTLVSTPISTPIPEPGTLFLLGSGLVGVAFYARRKKG